ncbi:hypothetical protein QL285_095909 [Trifolium repens]|nr:hypothetical protein QL285_095909 [Trifolium repens]
MGKFITFPQWESGLKPLDQMNNMLLPYSLNTRYFFFLCKLTSPPFSLLRTTRPATSNIKNTKSPIHYQ